MATRDPGKALALVRATCAALPDVSEKVSHGAPTFFVGKRSFLIFHDDHHGDGRLAVWCAAPAEARVSWIEERPEIFFLPPYVAHLGWVGVKLDAGLPVAEVRAVLALAHATVAAKQPAKRRRPA
jgi:hypothetical protein